MIHLPTCPHCGEPPKMVMSPEQAFCGNTDCDVINWNMTSTKADFDANATYHCLDCGKTHASADAPCETSPPVEPQPRVTRQHTTFDDVCNVPGCEICP